jgi:hypothetical protein
MYQVLPGAGLDGLVGFEGFVGFVGLDGFDGFEGVFDELAVGDVGLEVLLLLKPNDENVLEKEVVESQLINERDTEKTIRSRE